VGDDSASHAFDFATRQFPCAMRPSTLLSCFIVAFLPWLTTGTSDLHAAAIYSGTVPVWELRARGTAEGAGVDSAVHVLSFLDCQFTSVFAAQYSIVLFHDFLPFSRDFYFCPANTNCVPISALKAICFSLFSP
jgi:hypothetical protein